MATRQEKRPTTRWVKRDFLYVCELFVINPSSRSVPWLFRTVPYWVINTIYYLVIFKMLSCISVVCLVILVLPSILYSFLSHTTLCGQSTWLLKVLFSQVRISFLMASEKLNSRVTGVVTPLGVFYTASVTKITTSFCNEDYSLKWSGMKQLLKQQSWNAFKGEVWHLFLKCVVFICR